jgi:hypothetical protein
MYATHFRRCKKNMIRFFVFKKAPHGALFTQIEFFGGPADDIAESFRIQPAYQS